MTASYGTLPRRPAPDGRAQHVDWLTLTEVDGPFLTLPVLLRVWPTLDAVEPETLARLRDVHAAGDVDAWVRFVIDELLGWAALVDWEPGALGWREPQHEVLVTPNFVLHSPGGEPLLLGYLLPGGAHPTARIPGELWSASPAERAAQAGRAQGVELSLVTDGRFFTLVWSPTGGTTTTATVDTQTWDEAADRVVVRAWRSLLGRRRFTAVPPSERLVALLRESLSRQEEVTEALGIQVRRAVEALVDAVGRHDVREQGQGRAGLADVAAHEVYAGAVSVMMRVVFLLFAEERGLLPSDNETYAASYAASGLCEQLEVAAGDAGEQALEHSNAAWLHLLATFRAVHGGVRSARLRLPAYDGPLFDPERYPWLREVRVDDRTLLHALRAVQFVQIKRERRRLSFRVIDVEEIGYVYEGLLAYDAFRADRIVVGLVGSPGLEEEVPLADLEEMAAARRSELDGQLDDDALAADLAVRYRDSKIGSAARLATALRAPGAGADSQALQRLLAVTDGNRALAERLLPFAGIIRDDLRGLPTVVLAGALYVTAGDERARTGTHYTPRALAEQVAHEALRPLVYAAPGPLDTADESAWVPASAAQILELKVVDIAMGSGAFLVAACRYLGDRLVQAWAREHDVRASAHVAAIDAATLDPLGDVAVSVDAVVDPVVVEARREVVQHCLYGVDVNPMAVEMAKLSLWLVSMDPGRPFTFLDDRLVTGDSLLGVSSVAQVEALHMVPARGEAIHRRWKSDPTSGVRALLSDLAEQRVKVAGMPGESLADLDLKRARLDEIEQQARRVVLLADLVAGSALSTARRGLTAMDDASTFVGGLAEEAVNSAWSSEPVERARRQAQAWLGTGQTAAAEPRRALHWPLAFPEVFQAGGFDAVIGNPPFLGGQKLTDAFGTDYREYLVHCLGRSARGSADLVAYFLLRAHELVNTRGQTGLIATNTLAQGKTRVVGLDQVCADGVTIRAAVKSEKWPSRSAVLQYCAIWTSRAPVAARVPRLLDGGPVAGITPSLDGASRATGNPHRLRANAGIAFQGSIVLGMGFTMEPADAQRLLDADPRNAEVLFPYLNGQDLNSRPDCSASRWVINFHDWPEERAATYPECFAQVRRLVKPERAKNNRKARRERWWRYAELATGLYAAIEGLARVIAITLVSKVVLPVMVPTGQVFAHKLAVFATDDLAMLALLSSAPHHWWVIARGSTLEARINYSPSDVFETFPLPELTAELRHLGDRLDRERRELMLARQAGLTATYNLVHDPACADPDIVALRDLHRAIDEATLGAYGWQDLALEHGHHETRQGVRWTIGPQPRQEVLDRLLELNQERYAAEQSATPNPAQESLFR